MFALRRVATPARSFASVAEWSHVPLGPKDAILGLNEAFKADPSPNKINVGVGAYRTDQGKPWVLPSVQEAQRRIVASGADMEYPPISGVPAFVESAKRLAYGADSLVLKQGRVASCQSISGTGALSLVGRLLSKFPTVPGKQPTVYLPNPTWGNHQAIFSHAGLQNAQYRYWNAETKGIDWKGLTEDLSKLQPGDAVLLHACAHNPTGVDMTTEQWQELSQITKKTGVTVIFDNAYQGFASGDLEADGRAIRMFVEDGQNVMLCQSFAKNFGLYGQRVGLASVVTSNAEQAEAVESQIKILARSAYSNPPLHGARIVAEVCNDPALFQMWQGEIQLMSGRIIEMRRQLKDNLKKAGSELNWDHITNQIGMFSFTGMNPAQVEAITRDHHVYLTKDGRISMAGVTTGNVSRLAEAIHAVTKQ